MTREYQRKKTPRILVTNAKGGSGKTTLTTNLAAHYAQTQDVTIMDFDSQQSSTSWLSLRKPHLKPIHVQSGFKPNQISETRSWQLRPAKETDLIILDTPAAMPDPALEEVVSSSDIILIPVLPSMIDIKAVENFVHQLLQTRAYRKHNVPIAVIANRVRRNTKIFGTLSLFLKGMGLPVISVIRDTQQFIKAFEQGMGVEELERRSPSDARSMFLITDWIDRHLNGSPTQYPETNQPKTAEIKPFINGSSDNKAPSSEEASNDAFAS